MADASMVKSDMIEVAVPSSFLAKLWNIVEDPSFNECICWDDTGFSFHVTDPLSFSKEILPLYFKHNNLSSFIRQLNMYGFRKITPLEKSGLSFSKGDQEHLEFQHPYFVREHPELMQYIKRKTAGSSSGQSRSRQPDDHRGLTNNADLRGVSSLVDEVKQLREKQGTMDTKLAEIKNENTTLWRELAHMRNLHMKQQQIVNKLIQFLLTVVQPRNSSGARLGKRQLLAIGSDGDDVAVSEDFVEAEAPAAKKLYRIVNPTTTKKPNSMSFANARPQILVPAGSSSHLQSLQKELSSFGEGNGLTINNNNSQLSAAGAETSNAGLGTNNNRALKYGPLIADVTEELMDDRQPYITTSPLSGTEGRQLTTPIPSPIIGENVALESVTGAQSPPSLWSTQMYAPDTPAINRKKMVHVPQSQFYQNSHAIYQHRNPDTYQNANQYPTSSTAVLEPSEFYAQLQQRDAVSGPSAKGAQGQVMLKNPVLSGDNTSGNRSSEISRLMSPVLEMNLNNSLDKRDFSEFLDFMDTDIDSLRESLSQNPVLDSEFLKTLFEPTTTEESTATSSASNSTGNIVGNEVTVYQRPTNLALSPEIPSGPVTVEPHSDLNTPLVSPVQESRPFWAPFKHPTNVGKKTKKGI